MQETLLGAVFMAIIGGGVWRTWSKHPIACRTIAIEAVALLAVAIVLNLALVYTVPRESPIWLHVLSIGAYTVVMIGYAVRAAKRLAPKLVAQDRQRDGEEKDQ